MMRGAVTQNKLVILQEKESKIDPSTMALVRLDTQKYASLQHSIQTCDTVTVYLDGEPPNYLDTKQVINAAIRVQRMHEEKGKIDLNHCHSYVLSCIPLKNAAGNGNIYASKWTNLDFLASQL